MDNKRISELMDMLIVHMLFGRTNKVLLIAQAIRTATGFHTVKLDCATGFRNYYRETE